MSNKGKMSFLHSFFICSAVITASNLYGAQVYPEGQSKGFSYVELPATPTKRHIPHPTAPQQYVAEPVQYPYLGSTGEQYYPPLALPCAITSYQAPLIATPVAQESSSTRVKIAAAEALYYNRIKGEVLSYQEIYLLERLIDGLPVSEAEGYFQVRPNFENLVLGESTVLKRMDNRKVKNSSGCLSKNNFVTAEQIAFNLEGIDDPLKKVSLLKKTMSKVRIITHEEMFAILKVFPMKEQKEIYEWLVKKVFTKMSFYPPSFNSYLISRIDPGLVACELLKSGNPFWYGIEDKKVGYFYAEEVLKHVRSLTGQELVKALKMLLNEKVWASSDKKLLPLRDRLRSYAKYDKQYPHQNEWTAADLLLMKVPLNLHLLICALDKATKPMDTQTFSEVNSLVREILSFCPITSIDHNPQKAHLPSPRDRGIRAEVIHSMIQDRLQQIEVYQ